PMPRRSAPATSTRRSTRSSSARAAGPPRADPVAPLRGSTHAADSASRLPGAPMTDEPTPAVGAWRRFTAAFAALLNWLLILTVAVLIIPVTMQIFSRYTQLIPPYIWTEELARFVFIWMIMIGAMVGVRESTHFDIDIWPRLSARKDAALRLVSNVFTLVF